MYTGRCIGRVIGFLSVICGEPWAHEVIFHQDEGGNPYLEYKGKLFAKYFWYADTDIPMFQFYEGSSWWWTQKQLRLWIELRVDPASLTKYHPAYVFENGHPNGGVLRGSKT
jgi:hypothetical protein